MNSVFESFVCEVPMVVIPFFLDQPVNANCVEKLGVKKLECCIKRNIKKLKN